MELTKGIVTKISTRPDLCIRIQIDIDKAFAENINLLAWQDQMITLQKEEEENG